MFTHFLMNQMTCDVCVYDMANQNNKLKAVWNLSQYDQHDSKHFTLQGII